MIQMHTRFWAQVNKTDTCWLWSGVTTLDGYGSFRYGSTESHWAHRWSYEQWHGPIPAGLQLDHLCRVRNCVNPAHLEAVTPRINVRRSLSPAGLNSRKTHCKRGHPFNAANTYMHSGQRKCKQCRGESGRKWRERNIVNR